MLTPQDALSSGTGPGGSKTPLWSPASNKGLGSPEYSTVTPEHVDVDIGGGHTPVLAMAGGTGRHGHHPSPQEERIAARRRLRQLPSNPAVAATMPKASCFTTAPVPSGQKRNCFTVPLSRRDVDTVVPGRVVEAPPAMAGHVGSLTTSHTDAATGVVAPGKEARGGMEALSTVSRTKFGRILPPPTNAPSKAGVLGAHGGRGGPSSAVLTADVILAQVEHEAYMERAAAKGQAGQAAQARRRLLGGPFSGTGGSLSTLSQTRSTANNVTTAGGGLSTVQQKGSRRAASVPPFEAPKLFKRANVRKDDDRGLLRALRAMPVDKNWTASRTGRWSAVPVDRSAGVGNPFLSAYTSDGQPRLAVSETPPPGSYNDTSMTVASAADPSSKPGRHPMAATSRRFAPLRVTSEDTPGPGAYDVVEADPGRGSTRGPDLSRAPEGRTAGGGLFFGGQAHARRTEHAPGPGSYDDASGRWSSFQTRRGIDAIPPSAATFLSQRIPYDGSAATHDPAVLADVMHVRQVAEDLARHRLRN